MRETSAAGEGEGEERRKEVENARGRCRQARWEELRAGEALELLLKLKSIAIHAHGLVVGRKSKTPRPKATASSCDTL